MLVTAEDSDQAFHGGVFDAGGKIVNCLIIPRFGDQAATLNFPYDEKFHMGVTLNCVPNAFTFYY